LASGWWLVGGGQVESGFSGGKAPQVHAEKRRKANSSIQKAERSEFPISANGPAPILILRETRGNAGKSGGKTAEKRGEALAECEAFPFWSFPAQQMQQLQYLRDTDGIGYI